MATPLASSACERACQLVALFTLSSHVVVALGGNLLWLLLCFALFCAGAAYAAGRLSPATRRPTGEPSRASAGSAAPGPWLPPVAASVGLASVALHALADAPLALWTGGVLALGLGLLGPRPAATPATPGSPVRERALLGLAVSCAVFALVAHRPDGRDALLANLAVAAEGRMDLALLASDTLHGRDDLPIHATLQRLQSHELLAAAIALLTRIPPLYVLHLPLAALGAFFVPLAHAELFRRLTPRRWLASVAVAMLVLVCAGETERWFGNAAFLRIWQGDALFLFVFAPLLYVYAARYAESPDARGLLRLAAAQIAALGCSAAALWIAPVIVLAGLLAAAPFSRAGALRVVRGLVPSLYGVAAALALGVSPGLAGVEAQALAPGLRLASTIDQVLGQGPLALACLAASFTAWTCCPSREGDGTGEARRFAVLAPLVSLLVWLNPWTAEWVHVHVAGSAYPLALAALPIPVLVTLVLVAPLQNAERLPRHLGVAATAGLCAVFALVLPTRWGPSPANGVALGRPGLKVPTEAHQWAAALNEVASGRRIVAPPDVSTWVPTFRNAAHPLMVQPYLEAQRERVGHTAYRDRYVMSHYAGGELRHPEAAELFARGLELYGVAAVGLRVSEHGDTARGILRRAGYRRRVQSSEFEIWVRGQAS